MTWMMIIAGTRVIYGIRTISTHGWADAKSRPSQIAERLEDPTIRCLAAACLLRRLLLPDLAFYRCCTFRRA